MPDRKNEQSAVARIKINALVNVIKLGNKVSVRKHYALRHSCCSGSKDDGSQIVPFSFLHLLKNLLRIFPVVSLSFLKNLAERIKRHSGVFRLVKIFLARLLKDNQSLHKRNFLFDSGNFLNLRRILHNHHFAFGKRQNIFQVADCRIAAPRNINRAQRKQSQIRLLPFLAVVRNHSDMLFTLNSYFKKSASESQNIVIGFFISRRLKMSVRKAAHLKSDVRITLHHFSKKTRKCCFHKFSIKSELILFRQNFNFCQIHQL